MKIHYEWRGNPLCGKKLSMGRPKGIISTRFEDVNCVSCRSARSRQLKKLGRRIKRSTTSTAQKLAYLTDDELMRELWEAHHLGFTTNDMQHRAPGVSSKDLERAWSRLGLTFNWQATKESVNGPAVLLWKKWDTNLIRWVHRRLFEIFSLTQLQRDQIIRIALEATDEWTATRWHNEARRLGFANDENPSDPAGSDRVSNEL